MIQHLISAFRKPHFVICGDWRIDWNDAHEERREVIEVTNHPSFNAATFNNDIAVVKVNESMPCSLGKIWPACLPNTAVNIGKTKPKHCLSNMC